MTTRATRQKYKAKRVRDFFDNFYTLDDMMIRFDAEREWIVDHFITTGIIPYRKIGSMYVWHRDHVEAWARGDDRPTATA